MKTVAHSLVLTLGLTLSGATLGQPSDDGLNPEQIETSQESAAVSNTPIVTHHPLDSASLAENQYRRAIFLVQEGNNIKAETHLQQALELQQDHIAARELLVSLLLKRKEQPQAVALLQDGITHVPAHARFPLWLSQLHLRNNDASSALGLLEQHQERFQLNADYLGAQANLYQQTGRHEDARQYYLRAAQNAPQDGRWWLGLGTTAEQLQDWELARNAYRRARDYSFIDGALLQFAQQRLGYVTLQLQQQKG